MDHFSVHDGFFKSSGVDDCCLGWLWVYINLCVQNLLLKLIAIEINVNNICFVYLNNKIILLL
jgi:hypothetical protein